MNEVQIAQGQFISLAKLWAALILAQLAAQANHLKQPEP